MVTGRSVVGVRELRQNLSVYLARVKNGEALTVTEHGHVVAQLGPPAAGSFLDRLVAEGRAQAPVRSFSGIPRARRIRSKKPMSRWLVEMREDKV